MTLNNLLEEIQYGKDFVEETTSVNEISSLIDEDYNLFLVSKRVENLLTECDLTKPFIKKLGRAARNYRDFEDKILEGNRVSSVYSRMKMDSIVEDINSVIETFENDKKLLRETNKENIGKTIATLKYGLSVLSETAGIPSRKVKEAPRLLEVYVNKEESYISETL
ncbi:MAG: hypothetical protein ACOC1O_00940 [bacterium]